MARSGVIVEPRAEPLVVDSSVIVAAFMPEEPNHLLGVQYISGLERGDYVFHLPMLVVAEVSSAIRRRLRYWQWEYAGWRRNLARWERYGKVVLYPLNRARMESAVSSARRRRLRGADSIVAALAEELNMPLRTFDRELLARGPQASQ